jgi:hypothetical protein
MDCNLNLRINPNARHPFVEAPHRNARTSARIRHAKCAIPSAVAFVKRNTTEECEPNEKIARCVISSAVRVAIASREPARSIPQPIIWQIENSTE